VSERRSQASDEPISCWVLTEDEVFLAAAAEGLARESVSIRELHPDDLRAGIVADSEVLLLDWREVDSAEKALRVLCDGLSLREPAGVALAGPGIDAPVEAPLVECCEVLPEWSRVAASLARLARLRGRLLALEADPHSQAKRSLGELSKTQAEPSAAARRRRTSIESGLRGAIEGGELELYFQSRHRARSGRITGAEGLLRWKSRSLGQVAPDDFIPIAEDVGLIAPLGNWVMHELCRYVRHWYELGDPMRFSFNVSAIELLAPELPGNLLAALMATGVSPRHIELEVTESIAIQHVPGAVEILESLQELGVQIALDDFGTGYSSFSALIDLPLDTLKLDRSIISGLGTNPDVTNVAGAMIGMAHGLGLSVVAEGVETETQLSILRNLDCDEVQGFYYSPPVPAGEFERLVREQLA
jgi:EAL domain-containing protein (putative c-di-GMP-specific phosphodiesterase class I)